MNSNTFDARLTDTGELRLQESELGILEELVEAGDRGGFHFLYGEVANISDVRLTAKISGCGDTSLYSARRLRAARSEQTAG